MLVPSSCLVSGTATSLARGAYPSAFTITWKFFFRLRNGKNSQGCPFNKQWRHQCAQGGEKQLSTVANMFLINFHRKSIMLFLFSRGRKVVLPCIHTKAGAVQYNTALSSVTNIPYNIRHSFASASRPMLPALAFRHLAARPCTGSFRYRTGYPYIPVAFLPVVNFVSPHWNFGIRASPVTFGYGVGRHSLWEYKKRKCLQPHILRESGGASSLHRWLNIGKVTII